MVTVGLGNTIIKSISVNEPIVSLQAFVHHMLTKASSVRSSFGSNISSESTSETFDYLTSFVFSIYSFNGRTELSRTDLT